MCGIVGATAQRNIDIILLEGLRRLEYRGYDSAGMAVVNPQGELARVRRKGKVAELAAALEQTPLAGTVGLAHTRWATHGEPSEANAHPHFSHQRVALVHNGIIENYVEIRDGLLAKGLELESETDTELVTHLVGLELEAGASLVEAVRRTLSQIRGAYALAVMDRHQPDVLVGTRFGSPLVLGIGLGEHFLASDVGALLPVTQKFVYLEDGDVAQISSAGYQVWDLEHQPVERAVSVSSLASDAGDKGSYRHYMLKEIHEQPEAIANTLEGRISETAVLEQAFGPGASEILAKAQGIHIIACGTSYHAGLVARYWIESLAGIPCNVEIASEYRYRQPAVPEGTVFLTISQSGETADTLAAIKMAKQLGYLANMCICNVPESSVVRESDLVMMTRAGVEIGVASTKAFTTQLVALMLVAVGLAKGKGLSAEREQALVRSLIGLPDALNRVLAMEGEIALLAEDFVEKNNALFLGRGTEFPVAMEGALKLKEISYIHAEAYAAGELKHGPLALVDENLPVIVSAASNDLVEKLMSNLQEVRARGGQLYLFADEGIEVPESDQVTVLRLPVISDILAPVLHTIPLQLLAYYVAVLRGTDVDQPRNLAKSVTVE